MLRFLLVSLAMTACHAFVASPPIVAPLLATGTLRRSSLASTSKMDLSDQTMLNQEIVSANDAVSLPVEELNGVVPSPTHQIDSTFRETKRRSAAKALLWRLIAGSVTFATSYSFSGSFAQARTIVGGDFASKALTMFLGERLMNKSHAGRGQEGDKLSRSLAKALIWRLFAICNTLTMAVLVAKDLSMASKIAGSDAILKTAMMFAYERVWANVSWGLDRKFTTTTSER